MIRLSFREHYTGEPNTCGVIPRGSELRVYGHYQRTDVMDAKAIYLRVRITRATLVPDHHLELHTMRRRNETTWEILQVRINEDELRGSVFVDDVPEAVGNRWVALST